MSGQEETWRVHLRQAKLCDLLQQCSATWVQEQKKSAKIGILQNGKTVGKEIDSIGKKVIEMTKNRI